MLARSETRGNNLLEKRLLENGFMLSHNKCSCGTCDKEEVWVNSSLSEEEEDLFLFDERGNFRTL